MSFTVIICAHSIERLGLLREAIGSVRTQSLPGLETIVVCDHNPELLSIVANDYPDITAVANTFAEGLSGARNSGISHATGEIVAFLDDDAKADSDWAEILAEAYADESVMAVGGDIVPIWPDERPAWFPGEFDWVIGCSYDGLPQTAAPVRNLIGCNMSIRRDCLDAAGGFQNNLGRIGDNASGCEETELFIRMQNEFPEQVILMEPRARVFHSISVPRTRWRYFVSRCKAEGCAKALVTQSVGQRHGLSSECVYVRKTLPAGVMRGIVDAARGDLNGLRRAGAIVAGLSITTVSFVAERIAISTGAEQVPRPFRPILIMDADMKNGLPELSSLNPENGDRYDAAWCLIRSSGQPIKFIELPFEQEIISSDDLLAAIETDPTQAPPPPLPVPECADVPSVSVVIATRDRPDSLRRCLDSLLVQTYSTFDIVVVDNAPRSSATEDMIDDVYASTGRVKYVLEKTPGLGRAHNTGLAAAVGDVIAFTDDDVIVDPGWVEKVAANFAHSSQIGCVTGLILPAELQTRAQYWTERHGGFGKGLTRKLFDPETGRNEDALFPYTAGAFGSGANMAFRRDTLERMNGFDDALGAGTPARGGDDLAAFVAALQAGYQLVYEPGAVVWHHHRRSEEGMRRQAFGYGMGLGAYLTKQLVDDPKRLAFFARNFPTAVAHLFSGKSSKMSRLPDDYPRRLVWSERLGILMGVPAYLRSRSKSRHVRPNSAVSGRSDCSASPG